MFFEYIMYVMYVIASAREAPSACIYRNGRQRIKSLKMVAETWDKKQWFMSCVRIIADLCSFFVVDENGTIKPIKYNVKTSKIKLVKKNKLN